MYVGIIGVMIAGLQPLLLGALQLEGRLNAAQLGHAATAELLTMGIAAGVAGALMPPKGLRWIGLICAIALAVFDVLTLEVTGEAVTAMRAAAGAPSGVMIWLTIGMVTRAPRPERWSGVYLTLQTLAQFGLSALLTAFVVGRFGANGGFIALAAVSALAGPIAFLGPKSYAPLTQADTPAGLPKPRGLAALSACFLFLACIIGVWVYAEPLSRQSGHAPSVAGVAISLSLAFQALGGAAATVLAPRLKWFWVLAGCVAADLVLLALFAALPGAFIFLVVSSVFGFLWLFLMPFLVPMVIEADPTRRAAILIGGAQLLGGALGPLMASVLVTDTDARGAVALGAGCLILAMGIVAALHFHPRRAPAAVTP
jgi:hypothetical protein